MIPWTLLGRAAVPGSDRELTLFRRGDEFSIRIAGAELMNSRAHASEDALAELACALVAGRPRPRVLVGGLGMGFTLAAALRSLGPTAEVLVAELLPEVVEWNRGPLGERAGRSLDDERASVHAGDVADLIRSRERAFDAILLDVDNGPEGLTLEGNDWLYSAGGLAAAARALRPDGVLAVWSARPDDAFAARLRAAGLEVEAKTVRARPGKGPRHTIWLAR